MIITLWIENNRSKTSRISFHDKTPFEKLEYASKLLQKYERFVIHDKHPRWGVNMIAW